MSSLSNPTLQSHMTSGNPYDYSSAYTSNYTSSYDYGSPYTSTYDYNSSSSTYDYGAYGSSYGVTQEPEVKQAEQSKQAPQKRSMCSVM